MLIYATWGMLRERPKEAAPEKSMRPSFLFAIMSIAAADISMSLDNVVAILGVLASDGALGPSQLLLAFIGIAACVPILIAFSEAIASLMERFKFLSCICGGYLIYIAIKMIFEDEMIRLFFKEINFVFTTPAAIIFGAFLAAYGIYSAGLPAKARSSSGMLPLMLVVIAYSCMSVGVFSYLETAPIIEGWEITAEMLYGFPASGANAVYLLGTTSGVFSLCAVAIADMAARESVSYFDALIRGFTGMLALIGLRLVVCLAGMTFTFGFGGISPGAFLMALSAQCMILLSYSAVFCMINALFRSRALAAAACMLFALAETAGGELIMHLNPWSPLGVFFPSCQLEFIFRRTQTGGMLFYPIALSLLYIAAASFFGVSIAKKRVYARAPIKKAACKRAFGISPKA
jgi:hypothetical protein